MKKIVILVTGLLFLVGCKKSIENKQPKADLIVHNAKIAVMDANHTIAQAIAVKDGKVIATGTNQEILKYEGDSTNMVNANGRTLIPGLNDSHLHLTRGGRFFNAELRWDGVKSLKRALEMLKEQAQRSSALKNLPPLVRCK